MDILSYNRAVLSENKLSRFIESGANTKILVFVLPKIMNEGVQNIVMQFPYSGTITEVSAVSAKASTNGITEIVIEKCPVSGYEGQEWESILTAPIVIEEGKNASSNVDISLLADTEVNPYDYFRINIPTLGEESEGFTIQMVVKIFE